MSQQDFIFRGLPKPAPERVNMPRDTEGNTYLHELCLNRAPVAMIEEAVRILGADMQALNKRKLPPLGMAILYGDVDTVKGMLVLGSPAYFSIDGGKFFNAAVLAAHAGRAEILDTVLQHGGGLHVNKPGAVLDSSIPALCAALVRSNIHVLKALIEAGAALEQEAGDGLLTPLQMAAEQGTSVAVRMLVDAGADIECRQSISGMTALHYAVLANRVPSAEALLKMGADVNAVNLEGATPLMIAVSQNSRTMASLLINAGADVNLQPAEADNQTALMRAAAKGNVMIVNDLLARGADPLLVDKFNRTAAKYAYSIGNPVLVDSLDRAEQKATVDYFEKVQKKYRP